ncbi:argininosuccinate synthase [Croceiramulus getboli]|nr:argininosuccinate synthase [Flavobacteriaceae bacterium YJPT1-3]
MKKIVLAYSGGLDTSYCAVLLSQQGHEVHAVSVNTGGFSAQEIDLIKGKALTMGVKSYVNIHAVETYYEKVVKYLIYGNVLKNNTYPLSVSAERVVQAMEIINYAKEIGADAVAHGSTGAGNDQVRFDMIFQTLAPEIEIITPIRDGSLSRKQEIEYLQENGVDLSWEKAQYSVNKGLWGTSVGGKETLTSREGLPEEAYPSPLTKSKAEPVTLKFEAGELVGVNDHFGQPHENIEALESLAKGFGIGRDIHVGDTIVGIKGRVGFEAAAPLMILKAHHLLEKHTLSKWQLQHKDNLASWYGMHLHEGLYLDPVMRDIEAFLQSSQKQVSGSVYLNLYPRHFELTGIESPNDLMQSKFGQYGEENLSWTAEEVKGFIKVNSTATKIHHQLSAQA